MRPRVPRPTLKQTGRVSLVGVWLASFALLLQTVLPLLSRSATAENAALSFAGDLALCTSHGLVKLSATETDRGTSPADTATKALNCPLCQLWHSLGNALPASAASFLGPAYEAALGEAASAQPVLARFPFDPLQARAPPTAA